MTVRIERNQIYLPASSHPSKSNVLIRRSLSGTFRFHVRLTSSSLSDAQPLHSAARASRAAAADSLARLPALSCPACSVFGAATGEGSIRFVERLQERGRGGQRSAPSSRHYMPSDSREFFSSRLSSLNTAKHHAFIAGAAAMYQARGFMRLEVGNKR